MLVAAWLGAAVLAAPIARDAGLLAADAPPPAPHFDLADALGVVDFDDFVEDAGGDGELCETGIDALGR
eukprot:3613870-Prymnesium_polylepis.1